MMNNLKIAHREGVNSIFVSLEAGVAIGVDNDSIRIWETIKGTELQVYDAKSEEEFVIPGFSMIYRKN